MLFILCFSGRHWSRVVFDFQTNSATVESTSMRQIVCSHTENGEIVKWISHYFCKKINWTGKQFVHTFHFFKDKLSRILRKLSLRYIPP